MAQKHIHIIGGGLAGLSSAVYLRKQGYTADITIYEATNHLGGRCFTPFINKFSCEIDAGTHMFLKANSNIFKYLDYLNNKNDIIIKYPVIKNALFHPIQLWNLAKESVFNSSSKEVSSFSLLKTMLKCIVNPRPCFVKTSLKDTFINPFLSFAINHNIKIKYNYKCLSFANNELLFAKEKIFLDPKKDMVIFALPLWALSAIFPFVPTMQYNPITNIHFMFTGEKRPFAFVGKVGGFAHWYKVKDNILSVTISNTDKYTLGNIWNEAKELFPFLQEYTDVQEIIEKRATLAQNKKTVLKCKKLLKDLTNKGIFCVGDWTKISIPNTIEAAISSGFSVADDILHYHK